MAISPLSTKDNLASSCMVVSVDIYLSLVGGASQLSNT